MGPIQEVRPKYLRFGLGLVSKFRGQEKIVSKKSVRKRSRADLASDLKSLGVSDNKARMYKLNFILLYNQEIIVMQW